VFTYNRLDRRTFGQYTFDEATDSLHITWRYPDPNHPRLRATIIQAAGDSLRLQGNLGADYITATVHRVRK
jgi:hypothetical protein